MYGTCFSGEDLYLDLLFYHRDLHRFVAIELKLGRFKPGDMGQVELYLRWLDKHERREGEGQPIGLILCAEKNDQVVELLELDEGRLRVATYLTELPSNELLQWRLVNSIRLARERAGTPPALEGEDEPDSGDGEGDRRGEPDE